MKFINSLDINDIRDSKQLKNGVYGPGTYLVWVDENKNKIIKKEAIEDSLRYARSFGRSMPLKNKAGNFLSSQYSNREFISYGSKSKNVSSSISFNLPKKMFLNTYDGKITDEAFSKDWIDLFKNKYKFDFPDDLPKNVFMTLLELKKKEGEKNVKFDLEALKKFDFSEVQEDIKKVLTKNGYVGFLVNDNRDFGYATLYDDDYINNVNVQRSALKLGRPLTLEEKEYVKSIPHNSFPDNDLSKIEIPKEFEKLEKEWFDKLSEEQKKQVSDFNSKLEKGDPLIEETPKKEISKLVSKEIKTLKPIPKKTLLAKPKIIYPKLEVNSIFKDSIKGVPLTAKKAVDTATGLVNKTLGVSIDPSSIKKDLKGWKEYLKEQSKKETSEYFGMSSKELSKIAIDKTKNSLEHELINRYNKQVQEQLKGETLIWLPSNSSNPNPDHELNWYQEFPADEGINGEMPGDRWNCQCGYMIKK